MKGSIHIGKRKAKPFTNKAQAKKFYAKLTKQGRSPKAYVHKTSGSRIYFVAGNKEPTRRRK